MLVTLPVVFVGRDGDVGGLGVTYFRHDVPLWGPSAITVDPTGALWIADSQAFDGPRLLRVDPVAGDVVPVGIEGEGIVSMLDIAAMAEGIAVLNVDGRSVPSIEVIGPLGSVTGHIPLPGDELGLANGLSGLATTVDGRLVVELEGGARTALVDSLTGEYTLEEGYQTPSGTYRFEFPEPGATETVFHAPGVTIQVEAPGSLGTLSVLGVNPDGSFVISVDWMSSTEGEIVAGERQLLWSDADGSLHGHAEFPIADQTVPVDHPIALASDGYIYGLLTGTDHVEVVRFNYRPPAP